LTRSEADTALRLGTPHLYARLRAERVWVEVLSRHPSSTVMVKVRYDGDTGDKRGRLEYWKDLDQFEILEPEELPEP